MSQRTTTKAVIARKMLPKYKEEVDWCEFRVPDVDVADMDVLVFATEVPEEEREEEGLDERSPQVFLDPFDGTRCSFPTLAFLLSNWLRHVLTTPTILLINRPS